MDLSFLRRAEARFASRAAAHPDFGMLVASLAAQQAASRAVAAQRVAPAVAALGDSLVELMLAGPLWREARRAQCGAFNLRLARQRAVN